MGILIFSLVTLAGSGCTSQPPQITVEGQYANLSPMFFGVGSLFMKIKNAGGRDTLLAASVNIPAATVELHDIKDGKMVKVDRMKVPSRDTLELKPRSLHIMVFNMPKTVQDGSDMLLTLTFERSGQLQVPVRFEKPKEIPMHGGN
ncbi:MAG: copper chaperone PCu(A)C [Nitrospirota bacterium]|nr:copper chaperone PCu(A)C [Nitrospirota bacterium]